MIKAKRQFSVRGLLIFTAVISVVLAVAVKAPLFFLSAVLTASLSIGLILIFHTANFVTSVSRPRLTLLAWSLIGTFFACFTFLLLNVAIELAENGGFGDVPLILFLFVAVMTTCFLLCVFQAARSFSLIRRQMAQRRTQNSWHKTFN